MEWKKILALLLCFCMIFSVSAAFAGTEEFKALGNNETVPYGYS